MKTDATEHKTNGRRTANDVLITSFRAGVLAVLLLAYAGTAAGATTWVVDDDGGASSLIRGGGRLTDDHAQKGLCTIIASKHPDRRQV